MFEMCKNVTIYNIQNHHHYYSNDSKQSQFKNKQWNKLKIQPLNIHPMRRKNSKGISLSINNNSKKKFQSKSTMNFKSTENSATIINSDNLKNVDYNRSILKTVLTAQSNHKSLGPFQKLRQLKKKADSGRIVRIQNINIKNKPLQIRYNKKQQKSLKQIMLKKNYSNMAQTNITITLKNKSDIRQIDQKRSQNQSISVNNYNSKNDLKYSLQSNKRVQISSGKDEQYLSKSFRLLNNQSFLKLSDKESSSVYLSQILCRQNNEGNFQNKQKIRIKKPFKLGLWPVDNDKLTINSNYVSDQKSLRYQQSELLEHQSKNNFILLPFQSLGNSLRLGVQKNNNCLVSLKQVSFRQMAHISQQIQIYQMVRIQLQNKQIYKNILQLYQTLISSESYILVKQPYNKTLLCQQVQKYKIVQILQTLQQMLQTFQKINIFPNRYLNVQDIVQCLGIYKIHDLSAFTNAKKHYSKKQILQQFKNSLSLRSSKRASK